MTRLRAHSAETRYRPPRADVLPLELRRKALERGVAVVVLEDVHDDWTRQAIFNESRRQVETEGESDR
jgi:hypothetical protein